MRKICYWCEGTWCDISELGYMTHMSDDYTIIEVSFDLDDNQVDRLIHDKVAYS